MRQEGGHAFPTQVDFISPRGAWDSQAHRGLSTRTHSKEREMELHEIQKGQRLIECSAWALLGPQRQDTGLSQEGQ